MKKEFVGKFLSAQLYRLGEIVGKRPLFFLLLSLLLALVQCVGWMRFHHLRDLNELFKARNGRVERDTELIERYFPLNNSETIDLGRITRIVRCGIIIITANDGGTMFRKEIAEDVFEFYQDIVSLSIEWEGQKWNFSSICSPWWFGDCIQNSASEILKQLNAFKKRKFRPLYPIDWESFDKGLTVTAMNLGGVETDNKGHILSAKALRFVFQLEYRDHDKEKISDAWERKFIKQLQKKAYKNIDVAMFTSLSVPEELTQTTLGVLPLCLIAGVVLLGFSVFTCLSSDPVKSKPWLGVAGAASAALGVISAFGFVMMCGLPYIDLVMSVPFLMIGIGIDDSFVLIASWRRTNPKDCVAKRMGEAYSEAAVSITITSITNFVSFCAGIATPFKHTQIYAMYCITAISFCYLYEIIFFGACMALSGYREEKKLNPFTFRPVLQRQNSEKHSWIKNVCCYSISMDNYEEDNSIWLMVFFRDHFSKILINSYSRIIIVLVFFIYLILAGIGCATIKEGMDYRNVFQYNSSGWKYMDWDEKYFTDYPHRVQVVIDEVLDYSDPLVQRKVEYIMERFENASFCAGPTMTEHWLRIYKNFVNNPHMWLFVRGFNISNPEEFYYVLKNVFFKIPLFKRLSADVVFNSDDTRIAISRFIIQTHNIRDSVSEKNMLTSMYHIADTSDYKVVVYNPQFQITEQLLLVRDICIQTIGASAAAMIVVFFLFVPDFKCAFMVAICLASIEVGVIGYMSFWNVNLDPLSLICLIMCVGFSVDFASHISYSYVACKSKNGAHKIRYALYSAGMPVMQGACSTILGVFFLVFAQSYSFVVVFKVSFLIMTLAAVHAIFLLPVLLSLGDMSSKDEASELTSRTDDPEMEKLNGVTLQIKDKDNETKKNNNINC